MPLKKLNNKTAALELSVGTIIIIVIGMSMLILGLILVKNIFTGSIYNVKSMNDKVRDEINTLFNKEGGKSVVYLAEKKAEMKQGEEFGVAFGFKNLETGTSESSSFSYEIVAKELSEDCKGLTSEKAEKWIKARRTGETELAPGQQYPTYVRFQIPEDAPLCIIPFDIKIKKNNEVYTTDFFDVIIKAKGIF